MSRLQLNEPIQDYREFYGRNTEQMPKLIAEGRIPLSMAGFMKARLNFRSASEPVKNSWLYNYFDTGDGAVDHPDGRAKINLDSKSLRSLTPQTELYHRALPLQAGEYDSLQMPELSKKEAEQFMNREWLKQKQVLGNKVWRIFARHPDEVPSEFAEDERLLQEYTDLVFSQGYDKAMAVFRASPQDIPTMRSWYVYGLDDDRSDADGRDRLDDSGRLVGVAPEAQSAAQKLELSDRVVAGFSPEQVGRLLREEIGYIDSKTEELLRKLETYKTQQ